tara:strand:- start:2916 stop:3656 length:741 start_codon:yes stop_codon:yes gene_type:complete
METNNYELTENDFTDLLSDFNYQIESSIKTENISLKDDKDFINSILNNDKTIKNTYDELDFLNSSTYTKKELRDMTKNINSKSTKKINQKKSPKSTRRNTLNKPCNEDMEIIKDIINSEIEKYGDTVNDDANFKVDIIKKYLTSLNIDLEDNEKLLKSIPNRLKKFILIPNIEDQLIPRSHSIIYVCLYDHKINENKYIRLPFLNYVIVLKDNGTCLFVKSPKNNKTWNISKKTNIIFLYNPNHNF